MTVDEKLDHVYGACEEMISKGLQAGSTPGCIAIMVEVIRDQQQEIKDLRKIVSRIKYEALNE